MGDDPSRPATGDSQGCDRRSRAARPRRIPLGRRIYQSRVRFEDGKMYLLRVVVAEDEHPPVIVTAYRTSKIEKYWSAK